MDDKNLLRNGIDQTKVSSSFTTKKRVMIAGVGNMFMKDDGFGGAVIKKILHNKFPEGVEIKDFGTGGRNLLMT
ncbi:MAG: hypothetical protein M3R36_10920 [Bacteroidota bacterium]|nr:hypothetical protein [Bacteroidota bacterium]